MMKRILLIISLIPTVAFASSLEVNCSEETNNLNCTVTAKSDFDVSAIHFEYQYTGLKVGENKVQNFLGTIEDRKVDLYTDENKSGIFDVAELNFTRKKDKKYGIKLTNVIFYDDHFKEIKIDDVKNVGVYSIKKDKDIDNNIKYVIIILVITLIIIMIIRVMGVKKK